MSSLFALGQRWISDTEADLGLGIISEVDNRCVTISFPAAAESRVYAMDTAPISRVRYQLGDTVRNSDGGKILVDSIEEDRGYLTYTGFDLDSIDTTKKIRLPEIELDSFVLFSTPQARLFSGQIDKPSHFALRSQTLGHLRKHQQSSVAGLLGPRVQLLPHQLYVAHNAANRMAPRVLLADEVGLGKTIEAGLILHQQLISGRAQRALIVVPDSLLHQWLVEMIRRFNLHFTILDAKRCAALDGEERNGEESNKEESNEEEFSLDEPPQRVSENPFESAQLVLTPLSFLVKNPERRQQAEQANWDLLLVDEAHHLHWTEEHSSAEYQCIETLAAATPSLLLLTATPEQCGMESHFARLRLLDPDRYFDLKAFKEEEAQYQPVNQLVQELLCLLDGDVEQEQIRPALKELAHYLSEDSIKTVEHSFAEGNIQEAVEQATTELMDRHGTGRVLFRNTRLNVKGFPARKLHHYPFTLPNPIKDAFSNASQQEQLNPELFLAKHLDNNWLENDERVQWLLQFLRDNRQEKILLICSKMETAIQLEDYVNSRGTASAVFHEGLNLIMRDRAAAYFSEDEDGAQLLVCSEIGSEGRNFQFSHHLVLFDLPLNPDLLEQRIGRLDRIGQKHTINIHVPYFEDTGQAILLRWYHEGINNFEKTCAVGQNLFEDFSEQIKECLMQPKDAEKLNSLILKTQSTTAKLLVNLQAGRDQLLEVNSCNLEKANHIIDLIQEDERRLELSSYMERAFDEFGVEQDRHSATSIVLHPSDHMRCHQFPGLPEAGITATFHRETALARDDIQYLSWEHPMVSGVMEMIYSGDFGNTAVCTLKLPSVKPGSIMLEALFATHCPAPKSLQLSRYLPLTTHRQVIDVHDRDLSEVLSSERLQSMVEPVPRNTARQLVQHARVNIEALVKKVNEHAEKEQQRIIAQAIQKMKCKQSSELQRLTELAKVNPNIRASEIRDLELETQGLHEYLQSAQLRLDALRVIITVN